MSIAITYVGSGVAGAIQSGVDQWTPAKAEMVRQDLNTLATAINATKRTIGMFIGDGSTVIGTGVAGFISIPVTGTITKVRLFSADAAALTGSIVIDIWKDTFANFPPTVADTITAAAKPTITAAKTYESTALTGWTTAVLEGSMLAFNVDSVATLKRVGIELTITP